MIQTMREMSEKRMTNRGELSIFLLVSLLFLLKRGIYKITVQIRRPLLFIGQPDFVCINK